VIEGVRHAGADGLRRCTATAIHACRQQRKREDQSCRHRCLQQHRLHGPGCGRRAEQGEQRVQRVERGDQRNLAVRDLLQLLAHHGAQHVGLHDP